MKRAVIAARVSTEDQKEEGYGLPEQIEKCLEYIHQRGYTLVTSTGYASAGLEVIPGVYQEDYTGKTPFRPAIMQLQEDIEKHRIQVIVLHRTNRLGRRSSVQRVLEADFKARGVAVEYVTAKFDTDNHYGRFIRNVAGDVDELDYENIIYQLKGGREQAVKQGSVMVSRPPYGYRTVKVRAENGKLITVLEIDEEEARIIRLIFTWYVYGDDGEQPLAITAIAKRLTAMRVPTRWDTAVSRKGEAGLPRRKLPMGTWDGTTVHAILTRETYVGRWAYKKTRQKPLPGGDASRTVPAPREEWLWVAVPAIIDEELFAAAQDRAKHNVTMARRHRKFTYLFTGMVTCDKCKKAFCGTNGTRRPPEYRCSSKRGRPSTTKCDMPQFWEEEIDAVVWPWIQEIVSNPDKVDETLAERQRQSEEQNGHLLSLIATSERLIAEKKAEQQRVMLLFKKGKLDEERWEAEDTQCQREIVEQEAERAKLLARLTKSYYTPEYLRDVKAACAHIAKGLNNFTREEKREAYDLLNLTARFAVEDGLKVVHVECLLDAKKLVIKSGIACASAC
jgi:site-specific DNA recombinase